MRFGTPWRIAVLASLALLSSGQLCMLTTCLPRLRQERAATHACCRATPAPAVPHGGSPAPATGAMPCDEQAQATNAPTLSPALPLAIPAVLDAADLATLAPPAAIALPVAAADTGPPAERFSPAPAGLRAPPVAA